MYIRAMDISPKFWGGLIWEDPLKKLDFQKVHEGLVREERPILEDIR